MSESWKWAIEERQNGTFLLSNGGYPIAVLSSAGAGHIIDTAAKIADALNAHDRRASPTPPTTEGEAIKAAKRIVATVAEADAMLVARALLSSPRVEEVRREALEEAAKIADAWCERNGRPNGVWGIAASIRSLSLPDGEGKEKLATRGSAATAPTDRL